MSLLWLQGLVVGILLYGIVIFIFGVRNFNDFLQFTSPLNKKKNHLLAILYLLLPPFIFSTLLELVVRNFAFFSHPVTLSVILLAILAAVFIPRLRKVDWKLATRRANQRVREVVTPMQFFLWSFLIIISISLTWLLVGEFWIFNGFLVFGMFFIYLQLAVIYFFGSYFKRRYIEKQRREGNKYTGSHKFQVRQIHVYIFISLNVISILLTWLVMGDFWIFDKVLIVALTSVYLIVTAIWGFGSIIWKRYLLPLAERDSGVKNILRKIKANLTDIVAAIVVISAVILFFALRPLMQDRMSDSLKLTLIIIAAALLAVYLFIKFIFPRLSVTAFVIYLGLSVTPYDRSILSESALRTRKIKVGMAWLIFLAYTLITAAAVTLLIIFREDILAYFNLNLPEYHPFYDIILIVFAVIYLLNDIDSRLSTINNDLAHKRYYINKKRKFLMIELEEIKKQIEEEQKVKGKLEDENIQAAIELLRSKGYQIVIGPESRLEQEKKT